MTRPWIARLVRGTAIVAGVAAVAGLGIGFAGDEPDQADAAPGPPAPTARPLRRIGDVATLLPPANGRASQQTGKAEEICTRRRATRATFRGRDSKSESPRTPAARPAPGSHHSPRRRRPSRVRPPALAAPLGRPYPTRFNTESETGEESWRSRRSRSRRPPRPGRLHGAPVPREPRAGRPGGRRPGDLGGDLKSTPHLLGMSCTSGSSSTRWRRSGAAGRSPGWRWWPWYSVRAEQPTPTSRQARPGQPQRRIPLRPAADPAVGGEPDRDERPYAITQLVPGQTGAERLLDPLDGLFGNDEGP